MLVPLAVAVIAFGIFPSIVINVFKTSTEHFLNLVP